MYRKEECASLLRNLDRQGDEKEDSLEKTPTLKWHKVADLIC